MCCDIGLANGIQIGFLKRWRNLAKRLRRAALGITADQTHCAIARMRPFYTIACSDALLHFVGLVPHRIPPANAPTFHETPA